MKVRMCVQVPIVTTAYDFFEVDESDLEKFIEDFQNTKTSKSYMIDFLDKYPVDSTDIDINSEIISNEKTDILDMVLINEETNECYYNMEENK